LIRQHREHLRLLVYLADPLLTDHHLTTATATGEALPSPFDTDLEGTVRGTDSAWDRGAFELVR